MTDFTEFLTPQEAWDNLTKYNTCYYRHYSSVYSGMKVELNRTAERGSFWQRKGKCKLHVPIASDIAATSADLLFSEEPRFTVRDEETEENESPQQERFDAILGANDIHSKLNEAAESCSVMGDVFLKLNIRDNLLDCPMLTVVQADSAWAEYQLGILTCIHFFSILKRDTDNGTVWRVYERYERGKITMAVFKGNDSMLGIDIGDAAISELGFERETKLPIDEICAVHIANIRPNRRDRSSMLGRSDLEGLRGLMDSLDETYSSWMRDIRLAKARLIIPVEYLKRRPQDMMEDNFSYEFDMDAETFTAIDINTDDSGQKITPSQFDIRSEKFAATCSELIREIITLAGYAPQTFGIDINGSAQSGTALHIREKKSFNTRGKKQTYWQKPLEKILTAMVHLDAAIYKGKGSDLDDNVRMTWADAMSNDLSTMASAIEMLNRAQAVSTDIKVQMLHPDWTKKQLAEETERVKDEFGAGSIMQPMNYGADEE